ncbi:MAG: multidrug efflux RND transporter permease subunit [Deltaproteobacteria bacterium]|nr:multidrug efflux RND transporter permease subunit [Deltaproteobacteria bacterium]MBW2419854.1 multidrug efflux RND transporter permease subunit [Deltaproteobacteria bacterium]
MFSGFFIDRPKFAFVISILIVLAGLIALPLLPISQFPSIVPPTVSVEANFPGASAAVVEESVAVPIESQVNGVDDMLYMSSQSSADGRMRLTVTFEVGTDPDMAAVNVQNRVATITGQLPETVRRQSVETRKQSTNMLLAVNLSSPRSGFDTIFLSNYASINIRDALMRVPGVGDVVILGARDYSMRIWLRPDRMAALGITTTDVARAVQEQNAAVPAGQIGQAPAPPEQQFQYTVVTEGRLDRVEEFEDVMVRANPDGSVVLLRDIARVELGAATYGWFARVDGAPGVLVAVFQLPGANALDVAREVKSEMERLSRGFPEDVEYGVLYDTTLFVEASLREVMETLLIAVFLVILVVFVFLQDLRSTLIPAVTIPVSLIGTLGVLLALGFSLNMLTLFGLILAIGIVVDNAIVVIENVQRHMNEGLGPVEATRVGMEEVTGPVVAMTLVLLAIFVPVAFMPGITGRLYQQFAVTISVSVLISGIVALTLSPALCASVLRADTGAPWGPLAWFNDAFERGTSAYAGAVRWLVRHLSVGLIVFAAMLVALYFSFGMLPRSFIPDEDRGAFMIDIQLPDGASLGRTDEVLREVEHLLASTPGVSNTLAVGGYTLLGGTMRANSAFLIAVLDPWEERTTDALQLDSILGSIQGELWAIQAANVMAFNLTPIPGLGSAGGFEFVLQDTRGGPLEDLQSALGALIFEANQQPEIARAFSLFRASTPQVHLEFDRRKAKKLGVPISEVFATLQTQLGSYYVNDFNKYGRVYRVMMQAEGDFRSRPSDIRRLHVRSSSGEMVPLGTLVRTRSTLGPDSVRHYDMFRSATVNGSTAPGYSSGDAIRAMERVAVEVLPEGVTYSWTGTVFQAIRAGNLAPILFALAVVFVYLFLVAQYESWMIPASVMLSVPVAVLGAVLAQLIAGLDNNVYTQVGLVMLIGLASKNAILIVEFSMARRKQGASVIDAAVFGARLRFRAVMMTAFSFVLGVLPLVVAEGAGAASRRALGTAVFGGMLTSAVIGVLFIPVLYAAFERLRPGRDGGGASPLPAAEQGSGRSASSS